jgi:hypothetical protein
MSMTTELENKAKLGPYTTMVEGQSPDRTAQEWRETAMQCARKADYFRNLLMRCGNAFGKPAYVANGVWCRSMVFSKVPELAEAMVAGTVPLGQRSFIRCSVAGNPSASLEWDNTEENMELRGADLNQRSLLRE